MARLVPLLTRYLVNVKATTGSTFRAASPFAEDSSGRAFRIDDDTGHWIDYKTNQSGTLSYLLYLLGVPHEAAERILGDANFLQAPDDRQKAKADLRRKTSTLPDWVLAAYPRAAPESLLAAGFTRETLEQHEIRYDAKQQRIIFPIRDFMGRLVAVSGRATRPEQYPRYKVYSTEFSAAFADYEPENTRHVWGLHDIYAERRFARTEQDPLIIVEGYKACMWVRQAGFKTAVALMGAYLVRDQARVLARAGGPYIVMLDNEPGKQAPHPTGRQAALQVAGHLRKVGTTYLATYPEGSEGDSPDDLSPTEVEAALTGAQTPTALALTARKRTQP